jgi:two-component system CheB/CheR fusion protein
LETANDELRSRQEAVNSLAEYQDMVLSSLEVGLVVLGRNMGVTNWNRTCAETWGVREEEAVGRDLFGLDIGIPLQELRDPILRAMAGSVPEGPLVLDGVNRRGRPIRCRVRVLPLREAGKDSAGALLVIEETNETEGG